MLQWTRKCIYFFDILIMLSIWFISNKNEPQENTLISLSLVFDVVL